MAKLRLAASAITNGRSIVRRRFLWVVIGGTACLFVFMMLNAIFLREGSHNSASALPTASPSPMAPMAAVAIGSPDEQEDDLVEVPVPPNQAELPPTPIRLDKAAVETHQRMLPGFNADLRQQTGRLYGVVFKQLGLSANLEAKVIDILMQQQQQLEEQAFKAAQSGSLPAPPPLPEEIQAQQAQQDNQLRSVLGEAGFAQFNQYRSTIPDRIIIDQMNEQGANLSDSQSQQLLQILTDARQQIQGTTPNLNSLPGDQMLGVIQKQQTLLQQTVSDRVQSVLTPDQGKMLQGAFSRLGTAIGQN